MNLNVVLNPFARVRGARALWVGLGMLVALAAASFLSGVHLDGALDLHLARRGPRLSSIFIESLVDWLSLAVAFWAVAKLLRLHVVLLDMLGMTAIARAPYIFVALVSGKWALGKFITRLAETEPDGTIRIHPHAASHPAAIVVSLIGLAAIVWTIVLLSAAFREASGARGGKAIAGVGGGIIAAEIVSKLVLSAL